MSDKLKKHIDKNRSSFEIYKVDHDEMWKRIDGEINPTNPGVSWKTILRIAAGVLLILTVAFLFIRIQNNSSRYADGLTLSALSPELAEAELYYNMLVEEKMNIIKATNTDVDPLLLGQFQMLDSAYNDLKSDLKDNIDNEEVVDAMIQNYRIKLQILEQILENIQNNNGSDTNEDEAGYTI